MADNTEMAGRADRADRISKAGKTGRSSKTGIGAALTSAAVLVALAFTVAVPTGAAQEAQAALQSEASISAGPLSEPYAQGFVVTEAQFNRMFPNRDPFFTYDGLLAAVESYPAFARTGTPVVRRQEAAAFLANVSHETGGLVYKVNQNPDTYPIFCDATQPYGCPAGKDAYYGRGAIMLSWNFNYKAAGDALGLDLLNDPWLVERDPAVAWATALWYWNTQTGPGTMTAHDAMVNHEGFGETIRSLNGTAECDGGNPEQMQHRVSLYRQFTRILHTFPGPDQTC